MPESRLERRFWRFWLGGLLLLALMIAMNPLFANEVSPWGIRDHQSAGTALRVDAIQAAWQAAGVMGWARLGIAIDLVYIAVYSFGAYCGGRFFSASKSPSLRRMGWVVVAYDLGEALANLLQPFWMLPILGMLGLRARDVMGYTFVVFLILTPVVLILVTLLGLTLGYPL